MRRRALAIALAACFCITAIASNARPAAAKKARPGPCRQGQVSSVVDRPGTGPATTTSGSPCTVEKGHVVVELGYRNEIDAGHGGTSIVSSYPQVLLRAGIDKRDELIVLPPTMAVRTGTAAPAFVPSIGSQDIGLGWKHNFKAHAWFQDSLELLVTAPSGTNGYSAGVPTFNASFNAGFSLGQRVALAAGLSLVEAPGALPNGAQKQFLSTQPSLTITYSLDAATSLLAGDSIATPATPQGGNSHVLLLALQRSLSPGTVIDVDSESNLTPEKGYHQRAIGFGAAFYL